MNTNSSANTHHNHNHSHSNVNITGAGFSQTHAGVFSQTEEPIQVVPRRVYGPLKKEIVRGVAACKTASACWTDNEVFTWGTNSGQLGPSEFLPLSNLFIDVLFIFCLL